MTEIQNYADIAKETRARVLCYADAKDWQVIKKSSSGVVVTTHQESGIPAKIFKAEGVIDLSPDEVFGFVAVTGSSSAMLQKHVKLLEIVNEIDQDTFIVHSISHSAGGGLISPREYLDLVYNYVDHTSCIFLSCATGVDIGYPENSKYVRGWNYPSGVVCLPVAGEPSKTRLVHIIHTRLGGKVPSKLADIALPSLQVSFFSNLVKAIKESRTSSA